jgi:hypothetical protein
MWVCSLFPFFLSSHPSFFLLLPSTQVGQNGGGTVSLSPGQYTITRLVSFGQKYMNTNFLYVPVSNVVLEGSTGNAADVILFTQNCSFIVDEGWNNTNITLQHFTADGGGNATR